mmetsp:Transcript_88154/g.269750  ORF Transcript_88154/g.269750 Transcript_88154/m.269750 type:complete len:204 (+) Transcript_88154:1154-1765(+)
MLWATSPARKTSSWTCMKANETAFSHKFNTTLPSTVFHIRNSSCLATIGKRMAFLSCMRKLFDKLRRPGTESSSTLAVWFRRSANCRCTWDDNSAGILSWRRNCRMSSIFLAVAWLSMDRRTMAADISDMTDVPTTMPMMRMKMVQIRSRLFRALTSMAPSVICAIVQCNDVAYSLKTFRSPTKSISSVRTCSTHLRPVSAGP